jgi:flagellar L-ring protein precursor FlgH
VTFEPIRTTLKNAMKRDNLRGTLAVLLALAAVLATAQVTEEKVNPGSLYKPGSDNVFLDRVARKPGDILMIVIDEQSLSTFAASTQAKKEDKTKIGLKFFVNLLDDLFKPILNGFNASSETKGEGDTSQKGKMQARLSATVKEVLPNGNMVIEGLRSLVTNKETQTFVLRGTIRPQDVTPENTIKSEQIADAEIKMEGKGMIADRQRKGILTTLFDWLF